MIILRFLENIGHHVIHFSWRTYDVFAFIIRFFIALFVPKSYSTLSLNFLLEQIYLCCIKPFLFFVISAIFFGSVCLVVAIDFAINFNLQEHIGDLLVLVVITEFSPLFTAIFFLLNYSLATQERIVNRETLNEHELKNIYIPKIFTVTFFTPLMALLFATIMIISGYFVSTFSLNIDFMTYKNMIIGSIGLENVISLLIKGALFGFISIIIPLYFAHFKTTSGNNHTQHIIKILIIILSMLLFVELLFVAIRY